MQNCRQITTFQHSKIDLTKIMQPDFISRKADGQESFFFCRLFKKLQQMCFAGALMPGYELDFASALGNISLQIMCSKKIGQEIHAAADLPQQFAASGRQPFFQVFQLCGGFFTGHGFILPLPLHSAISCE